MSDDIVERLRRSDGFRTRIYDDGLSAIVADTNLMREAADEIERLRKWQQEACIALEAATTIGERHNIGLNYGNHDRLLREALTDHAAQ